MIENMITSLEFYSGIGGMHYALTEVVPNCEVLAAFDINTSANSIYRHNFPSTKLCQNNIQAISIEALMSYNADLWTMSPPCQPFTTKGLQLGEDDARTGSLFVLMRKMEKMPNPPKFFLLENVCGFEKSSVHDFVVNILESLRYEIKEYIVCPTSLGIPNSRPRFYILAERKDTKQHYIKDVKTEVGPSYCMASLESFLDTTIPSSNLFLDNKVIEKYGAAIDVVTSNSTRSAVFTKSYGSYVSGCGSYVCTKKFINRREWKKTNSGSSFRSEKYRDGNPQNVSERGGESDVFPHRILSPS